MLLLLSLGQLSSRSPENTNMTPRLRWFVGRTCALASLAYASEMKRAGHRFYVVAIAALFTASEDPRVVFTGPLPRFVRAITAAPQCELPRSTAW